MTAWEPNWAHILSENPTLRDGEAIEPPVAGVGRSGDMGYVPASRPAPGEPLCGDLEEITGLPCDLRRNHTDDRCAFRSPDFTITWPRRRRP